jgi:UDP-2,3-diacylglucosamine pyrophosphatase LpxH
MWSAEEVLVVSDLHLATERSCGLFQIDGELAEFLRWAHQNFPRCQMFLNGDVFDFLADQREEDPINLEGAAQKARDIADKHKEVFDALSIFADSKEHALIILGGNHDPEMALPTVQREIEGRLQSSCPPRPLRWLTSGEAALFQVGAAKVLIEHGDQYDPWNWIDHEVLRRVICLASRNVPYQKIYPSPPGSRLVINRFNHISEQFPWLQTLQPLSPSLLPLALEVILPGLAPNDRSQLTDAVKEFRDFSKRSLTDMALRTVDAKARYWAEEDEEIAILNEWLASYEKEEDVWGLMDDAKAMLGRAVTRLRNLAARRMLKRVSRRDTFFQIGTSDNQHGAVTALLNKGANLVIHGHTHAAKAYKVGRGLYLNTGTWGQLMRLPSKKASQKEWSTFIEDLRGNRVASFPRPTFARVSRRGAQTSALLCEWTDGRPVQHSAWLFENGQWQKEENKP